MSAQLMTFVLGVVATASCATATFWNQWAVSGPASDPLVDPVWTWRNLWEKCMQYTGEQYNCNQDVSVIDVPGTPL